MGTGDLETRTQPYLLESLKEINIVNASCGRNHTLLLSGWLLKILIKLIVLVFLFTVTVILIIKKASLRNKINS